MISLRILSFNGQETLHEITEEIQQSKADSLSLLFPRKAKIFKQKTDLQKLRNFCDEIQKEITIITQNSKARKEIESIGIRTLPSLEYEDYTPFEQPLKKESLPNIFTTQTTIPDNQEIEEVISDTDILIENKIEKILETVENKNKIENSDANDVKKTLEKLNISYIPIDRRIPQQKNRTTNNPHKIISKPVLHSLFILATVAFLLFGFIIQTVIPAAQVTITPSKKEIEMHINANFSDKRTYTEPNLLEKHNEVFMQSLQTNFQFTDRFTHVSKEFNGENAKGSIKLINNTNEDITLRKTTKLSFEDNLIIQLPEWITIPKNGNIIISFSMPPKDTYGSIVGNRGNKKKGEKLTIPGLPEEMQKNVYAEVNTEFIGGKSVWKYKIQKNDFEQAKLFFKRQAVEKAKQEANKLLKELNAKENNTFAFLSSDYRTLQTEVLEYKFAENEEEFQKLLSKEQGFIEGKIKVRITIYIYNIQDIINLIELKYKNITPDGMFLKKINKELLTSSIQKISNENSQIKVSFSTRGIYEYSLDPKSDTERIFIMNVKKHITSKEAEHAKRSLINNFKEIATAEINLYPFWVRSLPSLPEKINISIKH
ncbi:TPA: hypothetical protein EYG96_00160 [Candidatus Gracilibacteria bacterium]|nr:hypothetical protein [Candidatus Gracilibacteria bacterium]